MPLWRPFSVISAAQILFCCAAYEQNVSVVDCGCNTYLSASMPAFVHQKVQSLILYIALLIGCSL